MFTTESQRHRENKNVMMFTKSHRDTEKAFLISLCLCGSVVS
jgi:hypothetical protein